MNNFKHEVGELLLKKYFEHATIVDSNIKSFNAFIEQELATIIKESGDIVPTIIPHNIDNFKITLDKIWVGKPEIVEADGSKREILPQEARLRKLTYAGPVMLEVSSHINGIQRETFTTQIGSLPIMLKSKLCNLTGKTKDELITAGEDPFDVGGYFIVNGTEKVLIHMEDLAANRFMVETKSTGTSEYVGRLFSEQASYKIPHTFERPKDGILYISFTRLKKVPLVVLLKALGMVKDEEIVMNINAPTHSDEIFVNLYEFVDIKNEEDAMDWIAKSVGITQAREIRLERVQDVIDRFLLPHLGTATEDRMYKAKNLCKYFKQYILTASGEIAMDDKDHYMNKRIKMSGDLLADLFRFNLRVLVDDLLYNFQRIVKRGKFPSIKVIIREKLITSRIYSAMATGNWTGGRKGISQRLQRMNYQDALSNLQRVVSPLLTSQENFDARMLHPTHLGRLCPSETPEGSNIGLRKNFAMLSEVSLEDDEQKLMEELVNLGVKVLE
ncbi:MAG: DNA-directed RNA polymerase subunit B'' [Candidatus Woesearchaeota archaeon]